jgi:hypothetical protein
MLKPSIGIQAGYSRLTRDGSYTLDARLPHVLVPNRDRLLSLSGDGLSWTESAFHVDLVVARRMGKLRAAGFAGPSFFSLKADLLEKLVFEQKYPYDTGDITSKSGVAQPLSASPTGFNLGATLDMELQRHVAVGVLLRYARATAKMTRPVPAAPTVPDALAPQEVFSAPASPTQLDLGGFQLGLGARIYF